MSQPSFQASNAILYLSYGAFLATGVAISWRFRKLSKSEFLSSNRTQKANPTIAIPLALNFIASALGSGILFSYPQISTIAGLQGLIVYTLSSSLPLLVFAALGPLIRRKCPEGFVLTEWTRQRYGAITALYLSILTSVSAASPSMRLLQLADGARLATLFLYMVAELSALGQIVNALTGLDPLPAIIVEVAVTTIYTSLGGFRISFITDNIQGAMVVGLIILAVITVGVETRVDPDLVVASGLLESSLLGWQLIYILPVAILTNDFFISGFWLRTFASKTDRDLRIGVAIATVVVTIILLLVGVTGLLAAWTGAWPGDPPSDGSIAFFLLLGLLPSWVVGIVLVMTVALSTAAFDSLQSGMVSSGSNDLFRNRLPFIVVRLAVVLIIVPVVVVALKAPSVLQIYLISDLLSASSVPVLVIGLSSKCYWWRGFEVVVGGLGGLLTVFIFGTIYYGDAQDGAGLLILSGGLYAEDWSVFGAFVAAPVGGLLWGFGAFGLRLLFQAILAKIRGRKFTALDPSPRASPIIEDPAASPGPGSEAGDRVSTFKGSFF